MVRIIGLNKVGFVAVSEQFGNTRRYFESDVLNLHDGERERKIGSRSGL